MRQQYCATSQGLRAPHCRRFIQKWTFLPLGDSSPKRFNSIKPKNHLSIKSYHLTQDVCTNYVLLTNVFNLHHTELHRTTPILIILFLNICVIHFILGHLFYLIVYELMLSAKSFTTFCSHRPTLFILFRTTAKRWLKHVAIDILQNIYCVNGLFVGCIEDF